MLHRLTAHRQVSDHNFAGLGETVTDSYSVGSEQPAEESRKVHGVFHISPFHPAIATTPGKHTPEGPHTHSVRVETHAAQVDDAIDEKQRSDYQ